VIDTHCHLTFPEFRDRIGDVLAQAQAAGVRGVITIATTGPDAQQALAIARAHPNVFSTAGVHPLYADKGPHDWQAITTCLKDPKCVAWGELGLDRFHSKPPLNQQRAVLDEQLQAIANADALGLRKPIVLHCREAFADLIPVLQNANISGSRCVFHCFTGTPADMEQVLAFGAMVSFTGVATYKSADALRKAIHMVPLNRIMIETDAPFLSPEPHRTVRPCVPGFAALTAASVAHTLDLDLQTFHNQVRENIYAFFGIDENLL
jgi:TatD DNase family protein